MIGVRSQIYWIEDAGDCVILYRAHKWHDLNGEFIATFASEQEALAYLAPMRTHIKPSATLRALRNVHGHNE